MRAKRKKNRNDAENVNEKNTCNMRTKQRQNDHDHECKCNESIRSRITCQITAQFEKKNIKLNNSMNEKLFKRTSIFNNFRRKKKCDKHDKRRDFTEILCFTYIILVFQCESAKYMRATKKKDNIN